MVYILRSLEDNEIQLRDLVAERCQAPHISLGAVGHTTHQNLCCRCICIRQDE